MDNKEDVLGELRAEEDRMRKQRKKDDAKREAELERERQQDISSGKEVLDKKFQQLEFLMNKSKVSIEWGSKTNAQAVNEQRLDLV
jgi:ATP-dependent DNA helicase